MVQPTRPPANGFVRVARRVYNPLGFAKGYNFVLVGTAGALMIARNAFGGGIETQAGVGVLTILFIGLDAEAGMAVGMPSGMAFWVALTMHAVGVETYLRLTPAEAERLRNVSYKRQLEAGLNPAGRAGITADRIGEAIPGRA